MDDQIDSHVYALSLCLYFLPSIIAHFREMDRKVAVIVFNLFFGWTGIGWIILLIYASFARKQ